MIDPTLLPSHLAGELLTTHLVVRDHHNGSHHLTACSMAPRPGSSRRGRVREMDLRTLARVPVGPCCQSRFSSHPTMLWVLRNFSISLDTPMFTPRQMADLLSLHEHATSSLPGSEALAAHVRTHIENALSAGVAWSQSPAARDALELAATVRSDAALRSTVSVGNFLTPGTATLPRTLEEYLSSTPAANAIDLRARLASCHRNRERPAGTVLVAGRGDVPTLLHPNRFLQAALDPYVRDGLLHLPRSLAPLLTRIRRSGPPAARSLSTAVLRSSDDQRVLETARGILSEGVTLAQALKMARALER